MLHNTWWTLTRIAQYVNGEKPTVFDIMSLKGFSYQSIIDGKEKQTVNTVELKDVALPIWSDESAKLDLIPGTIHLINLEMAGRGAEHKLQNFVQKIKNAYDYILGKIAHQPFRYFF